MAVNRLVLRLVPNPLVSDRQYCRFYHLDVCELDDTELRDELYTLYSFLWGLPPGHWVRQRVERLEEELLKRKYNIRNESSGQRKFLPAKGVKL